MKYPRTDLAVISDIDWARLAAYLDGEGHLAINLYSKKNKGRFAQHYLVAGVTNTDPRLILWCAKTFGGHVNIADNRQQVNKNWRTCYKWLVTCRMAADIIRGCLPYLIIKREQAEIALAFQDSMRPIGGHRTKKLSETEKSFREECRQGLHDLKWQQHEVPLELDKTRTADLAN